MSLYSIQFFCPFPEINIFTYFDVKSKWIKLWVSAWRHLLALFISFFLVTNFYIKSCISKLKYDKMSWTFIFSKIVYYTTYIIVICCLNWLCIRPCFQILTNRVFLTEFAWYSHALGRAMALYGCWLCPHPTANYVLNYVLTRQQTMPNDEPRITDF